MKSKGARHPSGASNAGRRSAAASHLVADDSLPGFVLKDDSPDAKDRVVIRFFKKTSGASVPSVLPAVRAASPGRYTSRCALIPLPPREGSREKLFSLEPTGGEGKAWEASQETSKMPDEPCGKLGPSYVGDRMFREMNGDPTRVVFIDMGSELQIFDPSTLTSVVP